MQRPPVLVERPQRSQVAEFWAVAGREHDRVEAAFGWLHRYNIRRRHPYLGQRSPIDYENG